ncbi:hypothetical protein JXQ31_08465 [candidate division KSB1 bacterium]|nr:hypothetical protein [candidate division KSB1 bacterium]
MDKKVKNMKWLILLSLFFLVFIFSNIPAHAQKFFRQYWAEFDGRINNNTRAGERLRVNDAQLSQHGEFGHRSEARANGLQLIDVPEDLFGLDGAELYLEMWGGHPQTENKRFILNGKETYYLPDDGIKDNNCAYTYPVVPLKVEQMVNGLNVFQFACDRGKAFWGHFIIDNAAVRCYLKSDHPDLVQNQLQNFKAEIVLKEGPVLQDRVVVGLSFPESFGDKILSVEYFGRYTGYDDNGNFAEDDWHGYTFKRKYVNHIGRSETAPFEVTWDTHMIPDQGKPMAVKALVKLKNGLYYRAPVRDGLIFPYNRNRVMLFKCSDMPRPFWSRDKNEKKATLLLPDDLSRVAEVRLFVRIWDGGEGTAKEPFKLNGFPYNITSGKSTHDVVFTDAEVSLKHLKPGENVFTLYSDTEHHGIEMLLPGPCLALRFK